MAFGEPGSTPGVVSGVLTPEEEAKVHAEADPANKLDMFHNGVRIDPASGWGGAEVCAEVSEDGTMQCFDDNAAANEYLASHAPTPSSRAGAARALTARTAASTNGDMSVRKQEDCPNSWVCLWQDSNYTGRRLQWPTYDTAKTRHLDQYSPSFRDKTTSAAVNRRQRGVTLYDFRTASPDPQLVLGAGFSLYGDFRNYGYVYGGNWNDKVDAIKF